MKTFDELRAAADKAEPGEEIRADAALILQLFWACEALEEENEALRAELGEAEEEGAALRWIRGMAS